MFMRPVRETSDQLQERFGDPGSRSRRKPRRLFPLSSETKRLLKVEKSKSRRKRIKEAKDKMDALGDYRRRPEDVPVRLWKYVRSHWPKHHKPKRKQFAAKKKVRKTTHSRAV